MELFFIAVLVAASLLLAIILAVLQAIDLESVPVSHFELRRRVAADDAVAKVQLERERWLPKARALRRAVYVIILLFLAACAALVSGLFWLVMASITFLSPWIAKKKWMRNWVHGLFVKSEKRVVAVSRVLWPVTQLWSEQAESVPDLTFSSAEELVHAMKTSSLIPAAQRRALESRLNLQQAVVKDFMLPLEKIAQIAADERLGPVTLDALHQTGQNVFVVMHQDAIVGLLHARKIMSIATADVTAASVMEREVYYVSAQQPAETIFRLAAQTGDDFFLVVNTLAVVIGGVSLKTISEHVFERETAIYTDPRSAAEATKRGNS